MSTPITRTVIFPNLKLKTIEIKYFVFKKKFIACETVFISSPPRPPHHRPSQWKIGIKQNKINKINK